MADIDTKVSQHHVRRGPDGHVIGTLQLNIGPFEHTQDFDYKGQTTLIDTDLGPGHVKVILMEEDGKSCVTGHVSVKVLGIGVDKDLDKNCEAIAAA